MKPNKSNGAASPKSAVLGQLVASMLALGIVAAGAWSLLGQQAPYHPQISDDDVTKGETSNLFNIAD